ncbi:MAG: DNA mismatch repair protein MutS [Candidatus Latescibacterota bacterium]|nr:MAG: DNA mismatch repair protein MutS [Candidatus Latescibacterota bacterium]
MELETPMLKQYWRLKRQYPDAILLFRVGDFYEMFFEDAKVGSELLGLTLTSREHGKGQKVPLAGVPHHAAENYIAKLVRLSKKVAICEQVEDPRKAKGVVKRDVIQVITPGTALSENLLEGKANNYLASVCRCSDRFGLSLVDLSTGEFSVTEVEEKERLWEELERVRPSELLVPQTEVDSWKQKGGPDHPFLLTGLEDWTFSYEYAYDLLREHFRVSSLQGFGCEGLKSGICAAGAVLAYLRQTQKGSLPHINGLCRYYISDYMVMDPVTQRNLELLFPLQGGNKETTLLSVLDRTKTSMGGRLLKSWLLKPLTDITRITEREEGVEELVKDSTLRRNLIEIIGEIADIERLVARVCCGRANARDLVALKNSLCLVPALRHNLASVSSPILCSAREQLLDVQEIVNLIDRAIMDDPPVSLTEGGLIKPGFNSQLDELRQISSSGKDWIAKLQAKERQRTGISSLKVKYNKVFGYFIEVSKANLSKVPEDYIRRQTLVGAERFVTPELKEYESKVLGADEKMIQLEYEIFVDVRQKAAAWAEKIQKIARSCALIDVLCSLASLAVSSNYVRPTVDEGEEIKIVEGRHPVVERFLPEGNFVPNDTYLANSTDQILIITGPNMAGKSTYLRQVGLIVLLAQIGSFVPAKSAHIGVVDRIFTRVGASDSIATGESTFLAEMNETANILNNASSKSLVLLDEIGRGTSTFDGMSIAWAVTEFLHNCSRARPRTLFATHYHELTELELILERVKNYNFAVKEWKGEVVFLRKILPGGCDHSYGIQVARLAGLPPEVIQRAKEVLANLEENELTPNRISKKAKGRHSAVASARQLNLFEPEHPVIEEIRKIDPASLTPLEALNKIDEWKKRIE